MRKSKDNSRHFAESAINCLESIPKTEQEAKSLSKDDRPAFFEKLRQTRECLGGIKFPRGKPFWLGGIVKARNDISHLTEDFSEEEYQNFVSEFYSGKKTETALRDLKNFVSEFRQPSKEKRQFEKFSSLKIGSVPQKKLLVDAMEDSFSPAKSDDLKLEFPEGNFPDAAKEIVSELNQKFPEDFFSSHEGLSENVQTEILDWMKETAATLEKENPFADEEIFVPECKKMPEQEVAEDFVSKNAIQGEYESLSSVKNAENLGIAQSTVDFDFYEKEFSKLDESTSKSDAKKIQQEREILRRNFVSDLEKNLVERKNQWELDRIASMRRIFLENLSQKIEKFAKLEKLLRPFAKNFGRLWDLSEGVFNESGFEILEKYANILEKDEALRELADLMGKQESAEEKFEKELREKTVVKSEWKPQNAYRGAIRGIRYSNDISSVLPSEIAMMKNPAAKKLFQLKFAQKQLLSFEYENKVRVSREETEVEEIEVGKQQKDEKGPVIICVDTSGSMSGTPERIAKTVTYALAKIAMEEERKCYLISFSTGIETLDLTACEEKNLAKSLERLVKFLRMSFDGGTDALPALNSSLSLLEKNEWKNSDVLMVSDFVMASLPSDFVQKINARKEKGTCFYSLVINSGKANTFECFDGNFHYSESPAAHRRLVEQLHEIRERRKPHLPPI